MAGREVEGRDPDGRSGDSTPSGKTPQHMEAERRQRAAVRRQAFIGTWTFKLVGLAVFVHEAGFREDSRLPVLGICLFCMTGAQVSENVLLHFIDKFFDRTRM